MNDEGQIKFIRTHVVPCLVLPCSTAFSEDSFYRGNGECLVLPVNVRPISISRFRGRDSSNNMLLEATENVINKHMNNAQIQSTVIAHSFESEQLEGDDHIFLRSSMHKDYREKIAGIPLTANILLKAILWLGFNTGGQEEQLQYGLSSIHQYFNNQNQQGGQDILVSDVPDDQVTQYILYYLQLEPGQSIHHSNGVKALLMLYLDRLEVYVPRIGWTVEAIQNFMLQHNMVQPNLVGHTVDVTKFLLLRQIYV